MAQIKSHQTIRREAARLRELWHDAPVDTAKGWFVLGALWGLTWASWRVHGSASRFAGANEWACDACPPPSRPMPSPAQQARNKGGGDE